jgi:hypothetical protein
MGPIWPAAGDITGEDTGGDTRDISRAISVSETAVGALREQLGVANSRANWAELARDAARDELVIEKEGRVQAEGRVEAERQRADRAEQALARAEQGRDELLPERDDFWSRGRFRRAYAAWRGR